MKRERAALAVLLPLACLLLLALAVYFLLLPSITFFQAAREERPRADLAFRLAALGYRIRIERLEGGVLEDSEALEEVLESCRTEGMLLSPAVAFHAQRTDFKKSIDGPVAMAVCQDDPGKRFDLVFQRSPASGWAEAAGFLKKEGRKAVVVVTGETKELAEIFDDPDLFFPVEVEGGSMRAAEKVARVFRLNEAEVVCCPYVPDFRSFLEQGIPARWILDDSLKACLHEKFLLGVIEDDIGATLAPVLKAGLRHTRTTSLPLERRLVAEGGRL